MRHLGKLRHTMSSRQHRYVPCFAWFDEEQWKLLCALVPDRGELDDTYEQWLQSARQAVREIEASGHKVERVFVDAFAMSEWCLERDVPLNGSARAEYVAQLTHRPGSGGT
ncbi:MAG: hypothetical protein ABI767_12910 [Rhodanobacter sp.]